MTPPLPLKAYRPLQQITSHY